MEDNKKTELVEPSAKVTLSKEFGVNDEMPG